MISRLRFYMSFDYEWIQTNERARDILRESLDAGFENYDEVYISFEYDAGILILNMMSDRDSNSVKDLIVEIFLESIPNLSESDFDIEIDLDVEVEDYNDF